MYTATKMGILAGCYLLGLTGYSAEALNTSFTTSWAGNSLSAANRDHIPQNTYQMYVTPAGVVYTASGYEEGGYSEVALDTSGNMIGTTGGTYGGLAVAVDSSNQYTNVFDFGAGKYKLIRYPLGTGGSLSGQNSSNGDSISWGDTGSTGLDIRGMAINGSELYMCDVLAKKIVVFNTSTLHTVRTWNLSFPPGAITVDGSGNLWVVQRLPNVLDSNGNVQADPTGVAIHCFTPGSGGTPGTEITSREITGINPTGLAYDSVHNRLLVADNGPDQQVKAYTNLSTTPTLDMSFFGSGRLGNLGGIYSGSTPGLLNDPAAGGFNRFHALTGVGVDSNGNIYVAVDGHYASAFNTNPTAEFSNLYGATDIRKLSSSGSLIWQKYGNGYTQAGCFDPATDGGDLFTIREHYLMDLTKSPGQEAAFTGYTVGRFSSPYSVDPFRSGGAGGGEDSFVTRLSGRKFLIVGGSAIYKQDGELWRPCGYIYRTNQYTPQSSLYGANNYQRVKWYDSNNDGIVENSEMTDLGTPDIAEPPMIDGNGNWWVAGEGPSNHLPVIHMYTYLGLDSNGNPTYNNGTDYSVPSLFVDNTGNGNAQLSQIYYDSANDVMYLSGYTLANPNDGNAHTVIARFNSWSSGNRTAAYVITMPTDTLGFPQSNRIDSFDLAGGYIFAQSSNSNVHVYDKATGSSTQIVTFSPGSNVGGYTGANDNGIRVHAFCRSTGEYLVACEENLYNKIIFYRWNPGIALPSISTPVISPAGGTFASTQSVTITDATSGATIHYTSDGTSPTASSAIYTGAIAVPASAVIKAVAYASGYAVSSVASASFTINGNAETTYNGPHNIPGTIQSEDYDNGGENVGYYDTTSGNSGGAYRTDDVDIEACSDTAGGYDVGWTTAGEYLKYTVNVTSAGTYTLGFRIATTTAGTTLHMVDENSNNLTGTVSCPNTGGWQNWQTVNATVTLTGGTHILKVIQDTGSINLNYVTFSSSSPTVAAPTFSPAAGTYPGPQSVVINDTTSGATIYYTTDGTTPVSSSSTYSGAINVTGTKTVKAIGAESGYITSAIASAGYTIQSAVDQINIGGSAVSPYIADTFGSGGNITTIGNTVDTSLITNPAPQAVYQSERWGTMTYTITGLTASTLYTVRLHMVEYTDPGVGQREFNVAINGTSVLSNYDIYAATGALYKATAKSFAATSNSSGQIIIAFTAGAGDQPVCSGIELLH